MSKFDKILLEYMGTVPSVDTADVAQKLKPAFNSLPQNIKNAVAGITGAMEDSTQENPEEAALIDKLKDPNAKYSDDEIVSLGKLFSTRGIQFQQPQKPDQKQNTLNKPEEETSQQKTTQSSTSYGGNLQGI
jgi:hypothetical protein